MNLLFLTQKISILRLFHLLFHLDLHLHTGETYGTLLARLTDPRSRPPCRISTRKECTCHFCTQTKKGRIYNEIRKEEK